MRLTCIVLFGLLEFTINAQSVNVEGITSIKQSDVYSIQSQDLAFGGSIASIGDVNSDGIGDLVVGALIGPTSNYGGFYVICLDSNGLAIDTMRVAFGSSNFSSSIGVNSGFGFSACSLGDLNNDGLTEVVIGAHSLEVGNSEPGGVFLMSINWNSKRVENVVLISNNNGGFTGSISNDEDFGYSVTSVGDLDNDGVNDLAVGAPGRSTSGNNEGAVYILFLNANGTVKAFQLIDRNTEPQLNIGSDFQFGFAIESIKDLNADGKKEFIVGVPGGREINGRDFGELWVLDVTSNVQRLARLNHISSNFSSELDSLSSIGSGLAVLGDIDGNGIEDIAIFTDQGEITSATTNHVSIIYLSSSIGIDSMQILTGLPGSFNSFNSVFDLCSRQMAGNIDINSDGQLDIILGAPNYNSAEGQINFIFLDGISHISIPEFEQIENWVSISPNPSDGQIAIEQLGSDVTAAEIEVLNVNGQVVHTASLSDQRTTLELDVPSGNYFVRVIDEVNGKYQLEKIIVE
ncbi:MAG: FG-GAP repeat protein [Flavobacteriia bacterium]|nr:FG-GAP repeat protein [Flavobacteriia bacterium]